MYFIASQQETISGCPTITEFKSAPFKSQVGEQNFLRYKGFVFPLCTWLVFVGDSLVVCVDILFFITFHLMALVYFADPCLNQLLPWGCKMVF